MELRDYQIRAIDLVRAEYRRGRRAVLLRGEDPAASWPERRVWRARAREQGWPAVDTSGTPAETLEALLALTLRVLAQFS